MEIKKGIPVSPGYRSGPAFILDSGEAVILRRFIEEVDTKSELERLSDAIDLSVAELEVLRKKIAAEVGEQIALIFDFQVKMLEDENLRKEMERYVKSEHFSAEYSVSRTVRRYINALKKTGNALLGERAQDIKDLRRRLLHHLQGTTRPRLDSLSQDVILIAPDLTPSQTAQLDRKRVIGFATDGGGRTSHAAIVAKALGIPAVVGLEDITGRVSGGDKVIIDGVNGRVIVNPTQASLEKYRKLAENYAQIEAVLRGESTKLTAETIDGHRIKMLANIEFPEEIDVALEYGAEGIGLYRTEFIYAFGNGDPTEETQFLVYKRAALKMGKLPLILRTWDLGADKFHADTVGTVEANPFLGCRSIRFSFLRADLFKRQLRAILRASTFGNVKIMLPMISAIEELRKAKAIIHDTMEELAHKDVSFNAGIEIGMMIEVPSAAITSDILAGEVDFFSIGTNDLVQYALAVDRVNERVAGLYQPAHPAIIRLLKTVLENAEDAGIPVALCGEMSGDVVYTLLLLGLGLREISVTPTSIPEVKKVIRSITMREAVETTRRVSEFSEAASAEEYLRDKVKKILPSHSGYNSR